MYIYIHLLTFIYLYIRTFLGRRSIIFLPDGAFDVDHIFVKYVISFLFRAATRSYQISNYTKLRSTVGSQARHCRLRQSSSCSSYSAKRTPSCQRVGGLPGLRLLSSLPENSVKPESVRGRCGTNGCRRLRRYASPLQDLILVVRLPGCLSQ